ncbi:NYN domain-containing protein [Devosia sp.]|uniref:NYN domain-containing protein n=1 Tax=Devosia sp. TaxID=1871048 RepID=UPI0035B28A09
MSHATRVNVYVDGFNLYHAIVALRDNRLKWINLRSLGNSFLRPGEELNRVVLFTTILTWDLQKQQRHKNYIRAQIASGVEVIESKFRKMSRHCRVMDRYCARHEEKQTDVAIAVSMLSDAARDDYDRSILVTADSDQVPVVRQLLRSFPHKTITLAAPPERGGEARELGGLLPARERTPITAGRIRGCLLPRSVVDSTGRTVATMPAAYASP